MRVYYDRDADVNLVKEKKIAIAGYGSQGHAHALNLRDSGIKDIVIVLRPGSGSAKKAKNDGFNVMEASDAAKDSDIFMILTPDEGQAQLYSEHLHENLKENSAIAFAHGLNVHFGLIDPRSDLDVFMIAPKGPGHTVRSEYTRGAGVPSLIAVAQNASGNAQEIGISYAAGLGAGRAGIVETTFKEECETDLFGEQAVLCGGITSLIKTAFETLVEAGYQPESAYFEVLHEVKLIVDLIYEGGLGYMRYSVSDTAEFGDYTRGPMVVNDEVRENMRKILTSIQDGSFAREWIAENDEGRPTFNRLREENASHPIEEIGKELRSMMTWLKKTK